MASSKKFWRRDCDKSFRNIGRRSYWFKEPSERREAVGAGSRLVRTVVTDELKARGERVAPNFFSSRRGCCLNFGIA